MEAAIILIVTTKRKEKDMKRKNLISLFLAGIVTAALLTGCAGDSEVFKPNPYLEVVGTAPEGYMETFTSLENSAN